MPVVFTGWVRGHFAFALCLLACGGAARNDDKTSGPPAVGGAAGVDSVPPATSGTAGAVAGASGFATGGSPGDATNQAGNAGTNADAGAVDTGRIACGAATCASDQLCVARKCGGGPVQCLEQTDGGCPSGWHSELCPAGPFANQTACVPDPCVPPAPECVAVPASCLSALSCRCLDQTALCGALGCQSLIERHVMCNDAQ